MNNMINILKFYKTLISHMCIDVDTKNSFPSPVHSAHWNCSNFFL
jgi:hypothetical protein